MRKILFLSLFIFFSSYSFGQKEKGLATINKTSAEAHIGFLASDALQGREAGQNSGLVASEYIKSVLQDMGVKPFFGDSYFQYFEAYSPERQKRVRYSVLPDSIAKFNTLSAHRKLSLRNVAGYIEGKRKNEYVIIGAHFDHLGMDEALDGDKIYNGADDNASGVSAVLQIAKAFLVSGQQPLRTLIFTFWDGEELGLLGSQYFVQNCTFLSAIKGYLNFDMIGRNNNEDQPWHVVYFYTEANPDFGKWLKDDIKKYYLRLEPDYRAWDKPIGGSDNGSFARQNIPIIWYHTDGHPDYHQPSDQVEKINWDKLVEITKASYLNFWNLANIENY